MARLSHGPWFRQGKGCWYVQHEGRQVNLKVRGEENEKEAVKAWHRLMGGLPVDADPKPVQPVQKPARGKPDALPVKPDALSLAELVKGFLADARERVKAKTADWYAGFLEPFAEAFQKLAPEALTPAIVERFSKGKGWSASSRCGFVGTVASMFRWAVETGRLERNPVQGIRKPAKQSRGRKAIISKDDHERLLMHARGDFKAFLSLLWLTGCRPGEVSGLEAKDVDMVNRCIILSQHKTAEQTGKDRLIVLPDEAVGILRGLVECRPVGLLFPGDDGQRMTASNISNRMNRLCKKAGVKAMSYGYRHTMATDALASGVPDTHVAALLGHQGTVMLHKHYSHLTSRTNVLREALSQVRR